MGYMKELDIRIRSGGDYAIAAACEMLPQWVPIADRQPDIDRVLVTRQLPNGARYVDVMVWIPEPSTGLPQYPSRQYVTHWMPLPEPPQA